MINGNKWINSLPKNSIASSEEKNQIDQYKWLETIPKKNSFTTVKKYSLISVLFVSGLLFVSALKNETRDLEREINNLSASNNLIRFNLDQAILDNEVITSPENISLLASEYLSDDFSVYKKSQIKNLTDKTETNTKSIKKKNKISENIKTEIKKEIIKKKAELKKLKELYEQPDAIPGEVKTQVAQKIEQKKTEIKQLYTSPNEIFTFQRAQKWVAVQVVKVFLGIPIVPGK